MHNQIKQQAIEYLADYPDLAKQCAQYEYNEWGILNPGETLEKTHAAYKDGSARNQIPMTFIVRHPELHIPIAMASLWQKDGDLWPQYGPWVASVYVHSLFRKLGLAKKLIQRVEQEARDQGYDNIYLHALDHVAPMYKKMGYQEIDKARCSTPVNSIKHLFVKDLTRNS